MLSPRLTKITVPGLIIIALMLTTAHSCVKADDACKRVVKIALTQAEPDDMMRMLGLCGAETPSDAACAPWYADAPAPGAPTQTPFQNRLVPEGIDLVAPYSPGGALIVAGEAKAIDDLQELVRQLDVKPGKVGIDAQFLKLSADAAKLLLSDFLPEGAPSGTGLFGFVSEQTRGKLRETLDSREAREISSTSVQTLSNRPAVLKMEPKKAADGKPSAPTTTLQMTLTPRINKADRSITLFMKIIFTDPGASIVGHAEVCTQTQSVSSTRRVASGETLAFVTSNGEKAYLALITPRILD